MNKLMQYVQPPVAPSISVGQPPAPPPPQEVPPDFSSILAQKPKRGGLPIELIASIQKSYADEAARQSNAPPGQPAQLGLEPGWGGKGR